MSEDMSRSITIIGAGISGLVLGRCLLQRGIKATILEKARQSAHRNSYGITLHATSYRPLLKILNLEESAFRTKVAIADGVIDSTSSDLRVNRNRLERLLAEGLEVRWESEVDSLKPGEVVLKDGKRVNGEVIVGADGPHSLVRKAVLPEVDFKILSFVAYNGKRRLQPAEWTVDGIVFEQKIEDALIQVSVNEKTEEEVSISYTYSRPARKEATDALFRPERSKEDAKAIPEELFREVGASRGDLKEPLRSVFDPQAMRKDRLLNWLLRSVHVNGEKLKESAENGIVLMGDSVHAEPILGGEGANVAIEDGMKLAEILSSRGSLRNFYEARAKAWEKSVHDSESRISSMHSAGQARNNL